MQEGGRTTTDGDVVDDEIVLIKLADFGTAHGTSGGYSAREHDAAPPSRTAGTPAFYSPEMCVKGSYRGYASDTWAAGITLCMLISGVPPFTAGHNNNNMPELFRRIAEEEPSLPPYASRPLVDLLRGMLSKSPDERATLTQIRHHTWITRTE